MFLRHGREFCFISRDKEGEKQPNLHLSLRLINDKEQYCAASQFHQIFFANTRVRIFNRSEF